MRGDEILKRKKTTFNLKNKKHICFALVWRSYTDFWVTIRLCIQSIFGMLVFYMVTNVLYKPVLSGQLFIYCCKVSYTYGIKILLAF